MFAPTPWWLWESWSFFVFCGNLNNHIYRCGQVSEPFLRIVSWSFRRHFVYFVFLFRVFSWSGLWFKEDILPSLGAFPKNGLAVSGGTAKSWRNWWTWSEIIKSMFVQLIFFCLNEYRWLICLRMIFSSSYIYYSHEYILLKHLPPIRYAGVRCIGQWIRGNNTSPLFCPHECLRLLYPCGRLNPSCYINYWPCLIKLLFNHW